jgi:hypothetical protein
MCALGLGMGQSGGESCSNPSRSSTEDATTKSAKSE